jgi:MFS family permease
LVHRVVTSDWQTLLLCGGIVIVYNLANYMLLTYMPSYLSENLDISESACLLLLFVAIVFMLALTTRVGILSDRVGRKPVLIRAVTGFVLLTYPAYWLIFHRCLRGHRPPGGDVSGLRDRQPVHAGLLYDGRRLGVSHPDPADARDCRASFEGLGGAAYGSGKRARTTTTAGYTGLIASVRRSTSWLPTRNRPTVGSFPESRAPQRDESR